MKTRYPDKTIEFGFYVILSFCSVTLKFIIVRVQHIAKQLLFGIGAKIQKKYFVMCKNKRSCPQSITFEY